MCICVCVCLCVVEEYLYPGFEERLDLSAAILCSRGRGGREGGEEGERSLP